MGNSREMEMVAVRGLVLMPGGTVSFDIGREQSRKAVKKAMQEESQIFLICQRNIEVDIPQREDLYDYGTIADIVQVDVQEKGLLRVVLHGAGIAKLEKMLFDEVKEEEEEQDSGEAEEILQSSHCAVITECEEVVDIDADQEEAYRRNLLTLTENLLSSGSQREGRILVHLSSIRYLKELINEIAQHINMPFDAKQQLLEQLVISKRAELLGSMLSDEMEITKIRYELAKKMRTTIDENQKKYIYREQIKALEKELGEEDEEKEEIQEYYKKTEELCASQEIKDKIVKNIKRLESMSGYMSETSVIKDYIETMLEMPWDKMGEENHNLKKAQKILQKDHYGLDKIKERITEYLAVHINKEDAQAPIICLVGPPGTGKTSIARSIARALNRHYERICLGGVRDEAEIRGHRKTYVGAMPGRIAVAMRHAGVANPLLLLDEIDKMGTDHRGDVSAAMLEVLDGEQNNSFRDHYLEAPMDLSHVFFVATANSMDTIPRPLMDRMEVIEVSSYLEQEKFHIAKQYLVKKQMEKNGLTKEQITFSKGALLTMIRNYTRESGVRSLERQIGKVCRKAVKEILQEQTEQIKVTEKNLEKYLGIQRYEIKELKKESRTGLVHGLAWTSVGGDTLDIEVITMAGEGKIGFTGNLGDVMKESAEIAALCVRKKLTNEGQDPVYYKEHDIHLHVPEGAVPKDGPSAGITMATAIYSAITGQPVDYRLAMTGELSLLGQVMPIGGLKEKLVAAKTRGITKVLVPSENRKDVSEISEEILSGMQIVYVNTFDEVLKEAIIK